MITLPRYTYNLLFLRIDGDQEFVEHTTEKEAREHLALFGIEDADIYQRIDLFEQDWLTRKSRCLDTVLFPA